MITSKWRYFYGHKTHLMVAETGNFVETFFTPGACRDVLGLRHFSYDLPRGSVIYTDKAYSDYAMEDTLSYAGITFKPLRKKNLKRQFPP